MDIVVTHAFKLYATTTSLPAAAGMARRVISVCSSSDDSIRMPMALPACSRYLPAPTVEAQAHCKDGDAAGATFSSCLRAHVVTPRNGKRAHPCRHAVRLLTHVVAS